MDIHCEEGGDTSDAAGIADVHYLIYENMDQSILTLLPEYQIFAELI